MRSPDALAEACDVEWLLQEPIRIVCNDQLEGTDPIDLDKCEPTLWVGAPSKTQPWIVALEFVLHPVTRRRHDNFSFFLFLDPNMLGLDSGLNSSLPRNAWLDFSVRRVKEKYHTSPGCVFMRRGPHNPKPWKGTALNLLCQVRMLADATAFNLQVRNNATSIRILKRLVNEVPKYTTFLSFDESRAYGGNGGVWNQWHHFHPEVAGTLRSVETVSGQDTSVIPETPDAGTLGSSQAIGGTQLLEGSALKRSASQSEQASQKRVHVHDTTQVSAHPTQPDMHTQENNQGPSEFSSLFGSPGIHMSRPEVQSTMWSDTPCVDSIDIRSTIAGSVIVGSAEVPVPPHFNLSPPVYNSSPRSSPTYRFSNLPDARSKGKGIAAINNSTNENTDILLPSDQALTLFDPNLQYNPDLSGIDWNANFTAVPGDRAHLEGEQAVLSAEVQGGTSVPPLCPEQVPVDPDKSSYNKKIEDRYLQEMPDYFDIPAKAVFIFERDHAIFLTQDQQSMVLDKLAEPRMASIFIASSILNRCHWVKKWVDRASRGSRI